MTIHEGLKINHAYVISTNISLADQYGDKLPYLWCVECFQVVKNFFHQCRTDISNFSQVLGIKAIHFIIGINYKKKWTRVNPLYTRDSITLANSEDHDEIWA